MNRPVAVTAGDGSAVAFEYTQATNKLTIKKPSTSLADFSVTITL